MMKLSRSKFLLSFILLLAGIINISWKFDEPLTKNTGVAFFATYKPYEPVYNFQYRLIYDSLHLKMQGLSEDAFFYGYFGFEQLRQQGLLKNDSILTIVDFDQPSYAKRIYILDIKNMSIRFNTWVAHGKNSGKAMASTFSNKMESNKSSLGFYITDRTYYGGNGFSLKLNGLEQGLNDHAVQRAIVMHGAPYVSEESIRKLGYLGRSQGCPAVPMALNRPIIDLIKEGSCFFIYNSSYKPTVFL